MLHWGVSYSMNVLDLFSGIGGFSLGLERAGMKTIAFCEVDPKCRQVLRKHWPAVPIFEDIRSLQAKDISETVDVICGGFPCQDISTAGKGAGLSGQRSGLWWEFHRLIKEIKPKWAIIENVSALRSRGLDEVLRSLSEVGYDAEWHCITASSIGAPHKRDRLWIIAYPNTNSIRWDSRRDSESGRQVCDDKKRNNSSSLQDGEQQKSDIREMGSLLAERLQKFISSERTRNQTRCFWAAEPNVGRVADGFPRRVDRLRQLGNAVVPQIPELIGRAILQ